jgi:competence protein ComEA
MGGFKRHWLLILALAAVIVAGSYFYDHWQKAAVVEKASSVVQVQPGAVHDGQPVVYVSGAVNKPGVYKVGPESRVIDVVNAAGGLAPGADANRINLAQLVKDGMQINVPLSAESGPATAASAVAGKVSINAAGKSELEKLPGIGPVLAQRIMDYRRIHGSFRDVAELKKVPGIGDSIFNRIKDKISL